MRPARRFDEPSDGTGGYLESLGLRPRRTQAVAAGASELIGGLLLAAGLA